MVAIAAAVTMITAGAATAFLGVSQGMAAFLGGVAGSVASQEVGKELGVVDHFSLRTAVGAGITNALTFGLSKVLKGSTATLMLEAKTGAQWAKVAASAAGTATAGYVGNRIAGVPDTHFSWKSIAASTVTNLITAGIGNSLDITPELTNGVLTTGNIGKDLANGLIGGVVSLHVRRSFGFDDPVNYGMIAADAFGNAFGNALGNAVVRTMQGGGSTNPTTGPHADDSSYQSSGLLLSLMGGDSPWLNGTAGTQAGSGAFDFVPTMTTASGIFNVGPLAIKNDGILVLPTVRVTGDTARDNEYFRRWDYAQYHGAPAPRSDMSDADLRRLYRQQAAWRESLPSTMAHNRWSSNSSQFRPLGSTGAGPNKYMSHYNAINDGLTSVAAPILWLRAKTDALLAIASDTIHGWSASSQATLDGMQSAGGSAFMAVPDAIIKTMDALGGGAVDGLRMVTNTEILAETGGGLERLGGARVVDVAEAVYGSVSKMSLGELAQGSLNAVAGLALGGAGARNTLNWLGDASDTAAIARRPTGRMYSFRDVANSEPTNLIGNSGYASVQEFSGAAYVRYQGFVDDGYKLANQEWDAGRLSAPGPRVSKNTVLGSYTDRYARESMNLWLEGEGIAEGGGELIQMNGYLRDPSNLSAYRIPDINIPGANQIYDATLERKSWATPQVRGFLDYSRGSNITIVRPTELGGSYSVLPPW